MTELGNKIGSFVSGSFAKKRLQNWPNVPNSNNSFYHLKFTII